MIWLRRVTDAEKQADWWLRRADGYRAVGDRKAASRCYQLADSYQRMADSFREMYAGRAVDR